MITIEEFQSIEEWRTGLAVFLASPCGLAALRVLRDYGRGYDVRDEAEAIQSVRQLSRSSGLNRAIDLLEAMSRPPLPHAKDLGESEFGVTGDMDDHAASQYDPDKDVALAKRREEQMAALANAINQEEQNA
jgi:hypothetical protein